MLRPLVAAWQRGSRAVPLAQPPLVENLEVPMAESAPPHATAAF